MLTKLRFFKFYLKFYDGMLAKASTGLSLIPICDVTQIVPTKVQTECQMLSNLFDSVLHS